MKINEIFYSIQGEGLWTGLPNIFIRCSGCNLRCSFCDTKYAYADGKIISVNEIIQEISKFPCRTICITGGEPLLQNDFNELINELIKKNYDICIETNGSIDIGKIINKNKIFISLDIKCPSSKMSKEMNYNNISLLKVDDQLKFIIKTRDDYDYAKDIINKYKPKATIFFQPVWGTNIEYLSRWILDDGLYVRLGLQLHKIIWGEKQGF